MRIIHSTIKRQRMLFNQLGLILLQGSIHKEVRRVERPGLPYYLSKLTKILLSPTRSLKVIRSLLLKMAKACCQRRQTLDMLPKEVQSVVSRVHQLKHRLPWWTHILRLLYLQQLSLRLGILMKLCAVRQKDSTQIRSKAQACFLPLPSQLLFFRFQSLAPMANQSPTRNINLNQVSKS